MGRRMGLSLSFLPVTVTTLTIVFIEADALPLRPLALIPLMEFMQIRLEFLRHAHDLHYMRVLEQNFALFVLSPFIIS